MSNLIDTEGRAFYYLRLSIIDLCNFKCHYCLPNGNLAVKKNYLSLAEIDRLVGAFAELGVNKVRITGGEPSLRQDYLEIIKLVSLIPGIKKVVCTTNGYKLDNQADALFKAGLNGINVSVDTLNPELFHKITGRNMLTKILEGIKAAHAVGLGPVKINVVLLKTLNSIELNAFFQWVKTECVIVRFIELMETADNQIYFGHNHIRGTNILKKLLAEGWKQEDRQANDGPAIQYSHPMYQGKIGLIMPYAKDFCHTCNRLRVSATGNLHLCLFGESAYPLREHLQYDYQRPDLLKLIEDTLKIKRRSHYLQDGNFGMTRHLASIGG